MLELNLRPVPTRPVVSAAPSESRGALTYIGSMNGQRSSPVHSPYGAGKAGLESLAWPLAIEYAPRCVRVNVVAPGPITTPRMRNVYEETGRAEEFASCVPMGRLGDPSDVAKPVFLSSPLASYVTGRVIGVASGFRAAHQMATMTG
jgi:NAD(P)-dependent dehydrogenase (short-subunit alcohol dehydrogenase family)